MKQYRHALFIFILSFFALALPTAVRAQANSAIAGVVKDSSGAVLPGVTVEASSPALIEKVRSAVTDGEGQYKIVDLRPGDYTVTFTLTGFSTVKREGIELTASFTANVNAELRVGALEETITVSGAAPTVDVQNVVQQRVMTRDVIDAIPVGAKSVMSIGVLIPGVTTNSQDVGGTAVRFGGAGDPRQRAHEQQLLYDGVYYNNGQGRGGSFTAIAPNVGDDSGNQLRDGRAVGGERGVRPAIEHHPEGRRQQVHRLLLRRVHEPQAAERTTSTPDLIARGPDVGRSCRLHLRRRSGGRRPDPERTGCGSTARTGSGRPTQYAAGHLLQHEPGAAGVHARI